MAVPGIYVDEYGQKAAPATSYPGPSASAAPTATPTASAPAPTPSPTQPADHVTIPGYTPDWKGLITTDPAYLTAKANADQAQGNAAAQRKQALQQAITRYGGLPPGFTDQYGDIGQDTLDSAGQNQFSILADLARNYGQNEMQLRQQLAARGALQSGDLNYGEDQLQNQYGQQRYDAANAVGSEANNAYNAYTGVLQGNAQNLTGALQGAEQSVYSNPGYQATPASSANYDATNSATYGQPIYVDSSGNLFDQNGNPFAPGASGSAAPPAAGPAASGAPLDTYDPNTYGGTRAPTPGTGIYL